MKTIVKKNLIVFVEDEFGEVFVTSCPAIRKILVGRCLYHVEYTPRSDDSWREEVSGLLRVTWGAEEITHYVLSMDDQLKMAEATYRQTEEISLGIGWKPVDLRNAPHRPSIYISGKDFSFLRTGDTRDPFAIIE